MRAFCVMGSFVFGKLQDGWSSMPLLHLKPCEASSPEGFTPLHIFFDAYSVVLLDSRPWRAWESVSSQLELALSPMAVNDCAEHGMLSHLSAWEEEGLVTFLPFSAGAGVGIQGLRHAKQVPCHLATLSATSSYYTTRLTSNHSLAQAGLKLVILLSQPPEKLWWQCLPVFN